MQEEQRKTEEKLKPWVTHIKKTFTGDERFMMLQTYYRQNNYKPTDALKGAVSLLLQIPFFIAAYKFLSSLALLNGVSFGPINDLSKPDGLITIGNVAINVLPILMTAINIVSALIYTKGQSLKDNIQLYGMALIFLVLLYNSPSGLVFYWTLNNLFSLVKNIFVKLKNPSFVLSIISSVASILGIIYFGFIYDSPSVKRQIMMAAILLLLQLPIVFYYLSRNPKFNKQVHITKLDNKLFLLGCIFITVLTGLLIPSTLIKASPEEFVNVTVFTNPVWYIFNALLFAIGFFIIWANVFYALVSPKIKKLMGYGILAFSGMAVVNYIFYGDYGTIDPNLQFVFFNAPTIKTQLVNLIFIALIMMVLVVVMFLKKDLIKIIYISLIVGSAAISVVDTVSINKFIKNNTLQKIEQMQNKPTIPLSKNGKNVMVIMMDRAISGYIPYILNERPDVAKQFEGFTYYPNTMSYGGFTNVGTPVLFGGYDYTPEKMNARYDEKLVDKQNEALKVMSVLFNDNGFKVTVSDPSYAGYEWVPDLSIYDEYPEINKFITNGRMSDDPQIAAIKQKDNLLRNTFCYSIFRISPVSIHSSLYGNNYNHLKKNTETYTKNISYDYKTDGIHKSSGIFKPFTDAYDVLKHLSAITKINNDNVNTFLMMSNNATHGPMLLKEPEYEPSLVVDNTEYDKSHEDRFVIDEIRLKMDTDQQVTHYHANMASMIQLGKYMDFLRENDVYDNTKIIIIADHGNPNAQLDNFKGDIDGDDNFDIMWFNPLLLVKDFDSQKFKTDYTFMTQGDVPAIAMKDLIDNPINPFTNNPISTDEKNGEQLVLLSDWHCKIERYTHPEGTWYTVHDNVLDLNNWKVLDEEIQRKLNRN